MTACFPKIQGAFGGFYMDSMKENGLLKDADRSGRRFLSGVSILTLSAMIVKVIGLLYKIPLLSYLGTEGMGYFNTAYELYALFCVVSTAGLPVAMSVLISRSGNGEGASRIYRVALLTFIFIGGAGSLLMFGFSSGFSSLLKNDGAASCMRAISPTVFLICLSSVYRGFFQGHGNMLPTAISQVIEAAGKLFLGLIFAKNALESGCNPAETAAYAVMGLAVGTAISTVYLALHKLAAKKKGLTAIHASTEEEKDSRQSGYGRIFRALMITAIPVTISSAVIGLTKFVDLAMILRRLQDVGYSEQAANAMYGCYSTLVLPVFNILPSLISSVSLTSVPVLSAAIAKGEEGKAELRRTGSMALAVTALISIPASIGLAVFSRDVLSLIFSHEPDAVFLASPWLSAMAMAIFPACMITVSTGMLQASGHASASLWSMLVGIAVKVVLAYILIGMPEIGLLGAPVSSIVCDTVVAAINFYRISKYSPDMLPRGKELTSMLFFPLMLSLAAVGVSLVLRLLLGWEDISPLRTLASIGTVVLLYGAGVMAFFIRKIKRT